MATEPITPDPNSEDTSQSFFDFASTMPETADGFLDGDASPSAQPVGSVDDGGANVAGSSSPAEQERKVVNVTKKVRRAMNRFKSKAAEFPIMWFHQQAKARPEWELDADEQDLLKDSIETVFEILDIDVQIQPLTWTLQSIWWVIGYPILAFAFLFLTKKSLTMEREKAESEQGVEQS